LDGDRASAAPPRSRRIPIAALIAAALLLWLHRLDRPFALRDVGVDASWRLANVWFALTDAQAGVDWVLTCGPLGLVEWGSYHPGTFWAVVLAWYVLFELGAAATFACLVMRLDTWLGRAIALAAVFLLDKFIGAHALLLMLGATLLALEARSWRRTALLWAFVVLSCYAALKSSYVLLALPCAIALALEAGLARGAGAALRRAALGVIVFLLIWTAVLDQLPGHAFDYLRNGWQISSGYGEALSLPASWRLLGLALTAGAVALVALALNARGMRRDPRRALASALAALGLFLAFKMSFTRHGGADTLFAFGAQLPFLVWSSRLAVREPGSPGRRSRVQLVLLGIVFTLSFAGVQWLPDMLARRPLTVVSGHLDRLRNHIVLLGHLRGFEAEQRSRYEAQQVEHDLPRVREALARREVDLLGVEQAVLILNGFAWHPRPVFQGYHTYTPALRELNLAAFLAPTYPRHVLIKPYEFGEGHFPHQDEPDLLRLLARDFRPVLEERGFLLVERAAPVRGLDAELPTAVEREVASGEWIELPEAGSEPRVLFAEWPWTATGRALGLLYHFPRVDLVCELEDGAQVRGRITPSVARDGILLDPLLATLEDWRAWYAGERGRRVRRIALEVEPWASWTLAERARVRIALDAQGRPR
jgi:hypothetical protein